MLVARVDGQIAGYSLAIIPTPGEVHDGAPVDAVIEGTQRDGPLVYLSKMYIEPAWRGTGLFNIFMRETRSNRLGSRWPRTLCVAGNERRK